MPKAPSKLPSIKTVARRAGVSAGTVSNVLTARRGVTPELAARVRAAVAELGYIADQAASRLRSRRSTVAGVMVPTIANPFFAALVAVIEAAARADGYDLLIVSSGEDPEQEAARLRALLTWRPAGVIVVPCDDAFPARAVAAGSTVPLVAADRLPRGADFDLIGVDNRRAAAEATAHLLAPGRHHLLLVASTLAIGNVQERCEGAHDVARRSGGSTQVEVLEVGLLLAESRACVGARLRRGPRPDAIFSLNNLTTLATFEALQEAGLRVPDDIALVGFDDDEWMHIVTPPITAVVQPVLELGRAAWGRLMARAGGETEPPVAIRLDCHLNVRGSTGSGCGHCQPGTAPAS